MVPEFVEQPIRYCSLRTKLEENGSAGKMRKFLAETEGKKCARCGKERNLVGLHLDHIIPVALAGSVFEASNLQLLCPSCHKWKTNLDCEIIRTLKRLGYVANYYGHEYLSMVTIACLHRAYFELVYSIPLLLQLRERWDNSSDPSQHHYLNRHSDGVTP